MYCLRKPCWKDLHDRHDLQVGDDLDLSYDPDLSHDLDTNIMQQKEKMIDIAIEYR